MSDDVIRELKAWLYDRSREMGEAVDGADFPIAEMIARGWIRPVESEAEMVAEVLRFFHVASITDLPCEWEPRWPYPVPVEAERLRAFASAVAQLEAREARLKERLIDAAVWFEDYAGNHRAKGSFEKAEVNQARSDACRRALTEPTNTPQTGDAS